VCSVMVGTNRITNCQTLLSVRDQPLLQLALSPLRVSLRLPPDNPSRIFFEVVDNMIRGEGITTNPELRVVQGENNVGIFWRNMLLLSATLLDLETVHLIIDLRPVGLQIFDDHQGLHIGKNILARASFTNCMTAISLG
jgi:hypothetical protein